MVTFLSTYLKNREQNVKRRSNTFSMSEVSEASCLLSSVT